ncbi:TetR/AcrR family transcriptional regulator [uncultured Pseudomonas sp.]|uniref:TetR/AcrR family transcriptional regulator n=1 Tax=uncultured Pseudomonas sp. TaxID=114707 RepID=UPI0025E7D780|nr:TetR/AcrR family transcriptional regulator [uncultured Pseudomonas sp.]
MPRTGLSAEEIKARATDVALTRMRLLGVDKVRLTDVAKELGVSHAALYAHFADKAALLDAVTERWLCEIEQTLTVVACAPGDPTARMDEWLVKLYQMKRKRALDDPEPHRAFDVAAALDKPFIIAHLNSLLRQLADLFKEAGAAFDSDADHNARLLYTTTAAYHHPTLVAQTAHTDQEPMLRQIIQLVLSGMQRCAA